MFLVIFFVIAAVSLFNISCIYHVNGKRSTPEPVWTVLSPDGKLAVIVVQEPLSPANSQQKNLYYRVKLDGREILRRAPLGVIMEGPDGNFICDLTFVGSSHNKVMEKYTMPIGKKSTHFNHANETTLTFENPKGRVMHIVFRAYDDGIAWRYHFPGSGAAEILSEASAFAFPSGSAGWLAAYKPHHETFYDKTGRGQPREYGLPTLFNTPEGVWVLVTEAAVYGDYAGARLFGTLDGSAVFRFELPEAVSSELPWTTPWRVAIISDDMDDIVESVIVDNLNPPCEINDLSWIKPGRVTFPWWSDPKVNRKPERLKQFVDFAAEIGWEWIEFDTALIDGSNRGTDTWMTTSWVPELVKYAEDKGVSVYGWDNWKNLDTPEKRDKVLGLLAVFGIKGIKIDFLNSDSQERFKFRDDAIRDCLKYKMMVSFHGATIPRGSQRRWPHIAAWEAVHGAEWYMTWSSSPNPPSYNCTLPFTRNVVGSMDYTPVTFSTDRRKTTDAHEVALSVIFESGWQCLADSPESYNASPARKFLTEVHAAWDDIHFIDGYPGRFVCLARRKGSDWFIAAINSDTARKLAVPLDFLKAGKYSVTLYRDDSEGKQLVAENLTVNTAAILTIDMPANGGFAVRFPNSARP